ncbi:hypothetical protein R3W88_026440 [Solanum pinnatisectum]|uniref:Dof zinc finger protein n=1 Tax=Solanum pinnatisectum TaxID=50273 RepID=A0AAV9LDG7_9SOLN|nr:hypothetical protein R3W88_026440 [Solanum pinnatisectum]
MNTTKPTKPLKCPRCESTNTKFCYYNNYNKSQPRYLCKGCKRYWTQGGLLRNLPIGGGRKNKLKITSTSRDDNRAGQGECKVSLTLSSPKIFNPSCPAPTTSDITREKSSTSQLYETNIPFSIPTSTTSSNIYNYMENLDSNMEEESTITWQGPIRSCVMNNLSNYWNWEDIEALISVDDFKNKFGWN